MSIEPIPLARETYLLPDHSFPEVTFLLETGQCHSWSYSEDQRETCIFSQDRRLVVTRGDHGLQFSGISPGDLNFWMAWFGWQPQQEEELRQGRERLSQDPALAGAIRRYPYMRILSQDPYEVLISFILSANNNMKRIHNSLFSLCHTLGDPKEARMARFSTVCLLPGPSRKPTELFYGPAAWAIGTAPCKNWGNGWKAGRSLSANGRKWVIAIWRRTCLPSTGWV